MNGVFDYRYFLHLIVENDRQVVADVSGSKGVELAATLTGKNKADCRLAIFVGGRFRGAKIATGHGRGTGDQVPSLPGLGVARTDAFAGHQDSVRRQYAAVLLQGLLLARVRPAERLLDLKHRRGLHDFLDPRRIVHARKLDKNLILAEAVLLNHRLAHTQLVNSIADGLYGLGDRAVLQIGQVLRLHRNRPGIFRAGAVVVVRQPVGKNALEVAGLLRRNAAYHDHFRVVYRIGLHDVGVINLARAHVLFKARNRVVGVDVDRVVDLHLQDEVRPPSKIKPQMNAISDRGQYSLARQVLRNPEDAEQKDQQDPNDNHQLPSKVLIHELTNLKPAANLHSCHPERSG